MKRIRRMLAGLIGALLAGLAAPVGAEDLDLPAPPAGTAELRAGEPGAPGRMPAPRGNPLWSVPLDALSATRERPIFSPTRRPPAPPEGAPPPPPDVPVPVAAAPAQPRLTLIGTVVGTGEGYAIFLDPATGGVIRLRAGETHEGWVLRTVSLRDTLLQSGRASAILALPQREGGGLAAPVGRQPDGAPARPAGMRATADHIIAPRRSRPSPADLESSH